MDATKPPYLLRSRGTCPRSLRFLKRVARQTIGQRYSFISLDDAIQAGALGLVATAEHFEPERGVPFEAYARRRIQGATGLHP